MVKSVLDKIYSSEIYTNYLRYNPKWYIYLNQDPLTINDFEKEVKTNLKMTSSDKIANLKNKLILLMVWLNISIVNKCQVKILDTCFKICYTTFVLNIGGTNLW